MDDVLETMHIALSGTTSLLRKIYTGNTHLVHARKKINGGSHGRYQHTHRIDDTVVPNNGPYQSHPHSSDRVEKVVSKTGLSKGNPHFFRYA